MYQLSQAHSTKKCACHYHINIHVLIFPGILIWQKSIAGQTKIHDFRVHFAVLLFSEEKNALIPYHDNISKLIPGILFLVTFVLIQKSPKNQERIMLSARKKACPRTPTFFQACALLDRLTHQECFS